MAGTRDHTVISHVQFTSGSTTDVETFTAPAQATGCLISVRTNGGFFTFDGTTPAATNGLPIDVTAATGPVYVPGGQTIKAASDAAGDCVIDVVWLG